MYVFALHRGMNSAARRYNNGDKRHPRCSVTVSPSANPPRKSVALTGKSFDARLRCVGSACVTLKLEKQQKAAVSVYILDNPPDSPDTASSEV
ncbi:hypothetical protein EAI_00465 [Harpegnathos saltator]|uniref:Uncharacterized protein n=1 Tax=Harpegnathos saltator TaxID=610380 RepID=E2BMG2_HARSA|nr:hypothetical protein EAI_00465 [Harpegnathos saltator]